MGKITLIFMHGTLCTIKIQPNRKRLGSAKRVEKDLCASHSRGNVHLSNDKLSVSSYKEDAERRAVNQ